MVNYYEILEVSQNASPEIIEKAYKVLAKKYHPDLQEEANKLEAQKKMQQINEAYDVLSNQESRKKFDEELLYYKKIDEQKKQEELLKNIKRENNNIYTNNNEQVQNVSKTSVEQGQYYRSADQHYNEQNRYNNMTEEERKQYEKEIRKQQKKAQKEAENEYQQLYNEYIRKLGYRVKEKWTWQKTLKLLEIIGILIVIIAILWAIPPTRGWIISFYESNIIIKTIVDLVVKFVQVIWNTLTSLFEHPPEI